MCLDGVLGGKYEMIGFNQGYKYNPKDFEEIPFLAEDLKNFYAALEAYKIDESNSKKVELHIRWEEVYFSIKHREVEGYLDPATASEMRIYTEELYND